MITFRNENLPNITRYRYQKDHVNFTFKDWRCVGKKCFNPGRIYLEPDETPMFLTQRVLGNKYGKKFPCCMTWKLQDDNCPPHYRFSNKIMKERINDGWLSFAF